MNKFKKYLRYTLIGLLIFGVIWLLLKFLSSIVLYLVISGFIAMLGKPLVEALCNLRYKKLKLSRTVSAGITLLVIWLVIFLAFSIFIPQIASQANALSQEKNYSRVLENLSEPIHNFESFWKKLNPSMEEEFSLKKYAMDKIVPLLEINKVSTFFQSIASMLGDIFVAVFSISFITFFFLKEKGMFRQAFFSIIPHQFVDSVEHVIQSINKLLVRYFVGIILEVILVILLNTIGLSIIGLSINQALVIALLVGVLNVIPYLGPIIGASLGLIMGITMQLTTNINLDFYADILPLSGLMLMIFLIVQVIDNVVFQPLIYSSSVKAHPLEVFLIILVGGNIAGIIGMVLAVPTYTILKVIAKEFLQNYDLVKKLYAKL